MVDVLFIEQVGINKKMLTSLFEKTHIVLIFPADVEFACKEQGNVVE